MRASALFAVAVLGGAVATATLSADELWGDHLSLLCVYSHSDSETKLCVVGGSLGFVHPAKDRAAGSTPPKDEKGVVVHDRFFPSDPSCSYQFGKTDHYLTVSNDSFVVNGLDEPYRRQAAVSHWYLSGDYSTDPPTVKLTKEPTKYSKWDLLKVGGIDVMNGYIRNRNDKGKDAWLDTGPTIERFKGGTELHAATLSFERKTKLYVEDARDGR